MGNLLLGLASREAVSDPLAGWFEAVWGLLDHYKTNWLRDACLNGMMSAKDYHLLAKK